MTTVHYKIRNISGVITSHTHTFRSVAEAEAFAPALLRPWITAVVWSE